MKFKTAVLLIFTLMCLTALVILFGGLRYYLSFVSLIFLFIGSLFLLRALIIQAWQYASIGILMLFLGCLALSFSNKGFHFPSIIHTTQSFMSFLDVDWSRPLIGRFSCKDLGVCGSLLILISGLLQKKISDAILLIAVVWIGLFIYLKIAGSF